MIAHETNNIFNLESPDHTDALSQIERTQQKYKIFQEIFKNIQNGDVCPKLYGIGFKEDNYCGAYTPCEFENDIHVRSHTDFDGELHFNTINFLFPVHIYTNSSYDYKYDHPRDNILLIESVRNITLRNF